VRLLTLSIRRKLEGTSGSRSWQRGGIAEGSKVGTTLLELRRTVEELDPSQATGTRKLLGFLPFGDKVVDYFRKYQDAQSHLNGILHSLRNGQDELAKDNAALNMEKQNLWATMGRLNQYVYVAERLDSRLTEQITALEMSDPDRAKALQQDVLFYVRQKHQDLLTQLARSIALANATLPEDASSSSLQRMSSLTEAQTSQPRYRLADGPRSGQTADQSA